MKRFGILAAGILAVAGLLASCSNDPQDVNVVDTVATESKYAYSATGTITIIADNYLTTGAWSSGNTDVYTVSTTDFAYGSWSTNAETNTNYTAYKFSVPYSKCTSYSNTAEKTPASTESSVSNSNSTRYVTITKIGSSYYLTREDYTSLNTPALVTVSPEDSTVSLSWTVTDSDTSGTTKNTIKYDVTLTRK